MPATGKGNFAPIGERAWLPEKEGRSAVWENDTESPLAAVFSRYPEFRVLVVDDNRPVRMLIRSILLSFGVKQIDEASDGASALHAIAAQRPQLVISDWEMEPMNGLQFTTQIRRNPKSPDPDLPIVIMTGHTEKHRILEIRKAGVAEILAKPVVPNLLSRNILSAMARYEQCREEATVAGDQASCDEDYFDI